MQVITVYFDAFGNQVPKGLESYSTRVTLTGYGDSDNQTYYWDRLHEENDEHVRLGMDWEEVLCFFFGGDWEDKPEALLFILEWSKYQPNRA